MWRPTSSFRDFARVCVALSTISATQVACGDPTPGANLPQSSSGSLIRTCSDAELDADDHLETGAEIVASQSVAQYTPHCVRIRVGKTVRFTGPFERHPVSGNGEPGNPIPKVSTGTDSGPITFTAPGTFGFRCEDHPSVMFGAVKVVP